MAVWRPCPFLTRDTTEEEEEVLQVIVAQQETRGIIRVILRPDKD